MENIVNLSGEWGYKLYNIIDNNEVFLEEGTILLPNTTSNARIGMQNDEILLGCLTDSYKFVGHAYFTCKFNVTSEMANAENTLIIERTRLTTAFVDGYKVGSYDSLTTPHTFLLPKLTACEHTLTVMVSNMDYPTRGGHLTSQDTQTNWNGMVGQILIKSFSGAFVSNIKVTSDIAKGCIHVRGLLHNCTVPKNANITVSAQNFSSEVQYFKQVYCSGETFTCDVSLGTNVAFWSDIEPNLYTLSINIDGNNINTTFGIRDFKANGLQLTINGKETFLRGKHDGLIFPLTGYAPMEKSEWLRVMGIAKSFGINHYRFHTAVPPEAAFEAADELGIYMEPELPFWGTITKDGDKDHNAAEQQYLITEGFRLLESYGNHPSFVMMSLGNELWGDKEKINKMLHDYKQFDNRHLYTEGSNNFQFAPLILPEDDFLCGVRLSKDRLYRGSYATCDAPLGHIQTEAPTCSHNYNEIICPRSVDTVVPTNGKDTIEIQYGTGTKKVNVDSIKSELIPNIPVISHEVGQYEAFPDFTEIGKYTGSLQPRNLLTFMKRLEDKGMLSQADDFYMASGSLALQCYKDEIETALRTQNLAGFQLLDLQDFTGQGTALVGMLNPFMEPKRMVTASYFSGFCGDTVLLCSFPKYVYNTDEPFVADIYISSNSYEQQTGKIVTAKIQVDDEICFKQAFTVDTLACRLTRLATISYQFCNADVPKKYTVTLEMGEHVQNSYTLWVYPKLDISYSNNITFNGKNVTVAHTYEEATELQKAGKKVLYLPTDLADTIQGFYCTDFWCYPMFRSISESVHRAVPVGTMGLLIDSQDTIFQTFPTEFFTTPQWYNIVTHSDCAVLDNMEIKPIVQMIDNFERNHKLGVIYNIVTEQGLLLTCTCKLWEIMDSVEAPWLLKALLENV